MLMRPPGSAATLRPAHDAPKFCASAKASSNLPVHIRVTMQGGAARRSGLCMELDQHRRDISAMVREKISATLKDAMKSKNEVAVSTLRMINAAIKQKDIDVARARGEEKISEEEVLSLLQALIKSRREAIEMFRQGNRDDLIQKETAEIGVIEQFLPQQLGAEETQAAIDAAIAKTGAASVKDMGKVMAVLKTDYAGQLDMSRASALVKQRLGSA
jgi:hypothetical protein